ncbi:hypothetical protein IQ266_10460 [filamentous cyanobacterium LEGE 11480]|uniref:Uncharacterized protein n=1 Tax=Romeriopsis navalis LEGE 11480 TaxID=2777977 RepID=A0A928Z288_9CYAN|nr:hypothetical protein [Romeriopsis navalis]MBE9030151.1 hypothetical protein [Romeriopsis navalis LEGE 11480]
MRKMPNRRNESNVAESRDIQVVDESEIALGQLFDKFVQASPGEQWVLQPAIEKVSAELAGARFRLFQSDVLVKETDLVLLNQIREEIDKAADNQTLIMSALKLAAFLGVFA